MYIGLSCILPRVRRQKAGLWVAQTRRRCGDGGAGCAVGDIAGRGGQCCWNPRLWSQATKCMWWMPWRLQAMKDVAACEKLRGAGKRALIRRCPNGETRPTVKRLSRARTCALKASKTKRVQEEVLREGSAA